MKKLTLSIAAIMAMSTFAVAAGGTYDADGPDSYAAGGPSLSYDGGYYYGAAYGSVSTEGDGSAPTEALNLEIDHATIMLQAGYQFNSYLAIEGRYWMVFTNSDGSVSYTDNVDPNNNEYVSGSLDDDTTIWGLYVKPMYPVTTTFTAYGLLGYGNVDYDFGGISSDDDSFQWGLGTSYTFDNNLVLYIDYLSMYDDDDTIGNVSTELTVDSWNFGFSYRF